MRVLARSTLEAFWSQSAYKDSEGPLKAWYQEALKASWKTPNALKAQFRSASTVGENRVVFNIKGNDYRLIVSIDYERQAMFVKFIGTHEQYDQIDATTVEMS